jgi:hypothetical protein
MQDEFVNRLGMFRTALGTLHEDQFMLVWHNQPPTIFTTKVEAAEQAADELEELGQQQEAVITGATQAKKTEEGELEQEAYVFGSILAIWFRDQRSEEKASQVDLTLSGWRRLRDQQLLGKARLVHRIGESVTTGPDAATAATYGITPEALASLKKETDDYEEVIVAPQAAIAQRKALTQQLRQRFN